VPEDPGARFFAEIFAMLAAVIGFGTSSLGVDVESGGLSRAFFTEDSSVSFAMTKSVLFAVSCLRSGALGRVSSSSGDRFLFWLDDEGASTASGGASSDAVKISRAGSYMLEPRLSPMMATRVVDCGLNHDAGCRDG